MGFEKWAILGDNGSSLHPLWTCTHLNSSISSFVSSLNLISLLHPSNFMPTNSNLQLKELIWRNNDRGHVEVNVSTSGL